MAGGPGPAPAGRVPGSLPPAPGPDSIPGWAALEPEALRQRLAHHSGLPGERIARALHLPGAPHAAGFLEAIQTLHHLGRIR